MTRRRLLAFAFAAFLAAPMLSTAQRLTVADNVKPYVAVDAPVVALTNARVIDGTGAPARANQTLIIQDGNIAAIGDASAVAVPAGATTIDLTGKTVMPGMVMVHEHLYYPTGPGVYVVSRLPSTAAVSGARCRPFSLRMSR